jgi:signal recognition particle GTPase
MPLKEKGVNMQDFKFFLFDTLNIGFSRFGKKEKDKLLKALGEALFKADFSLECLEKLMTFLAKKEIILTKEDAHIIIPDEKTMDEMLQKVKEKLSLIKKPIK